MPHIGMQELILILVLALLFFGPKKLPELARGLGQGLRELKKAMYDMPPDTEEIRSEDAGTAPRTPTSRE